MKLLKNWDNKTWLSSSSYISSFTSFLLKKKKLNKKSKILDIGCGRGKIFGSLSRKIKLKTKPIGIDPVTHIDIDKSIDFRNEDIFKFFETNESKFDLIMIKQTLHFFNKDKRKKLIKMCKNNLKKNGLLIIFSLNTVNNEINLRINLQLIQLLTKLLNNEKLDPAEYDNLKNLTKIFEDFTKNRTFVNNSDIDFIKKEIREK